MNVTIVENGSVDPGNSEDVVPFSSWASSQSVQLAKSTIQDALAGEGEEYQDSPVEWYLQWVPSNSAFLITTTMTIEPPADAIGWPSRLYHDLESTAPNTVTVTIQSNKQSVSTEFPVHTRAKLLTTSGSSRLPREE